jgi:hypothetical protein
MALGGVVLSEARLRVRPDKLKSECCFSGLGLDPERSLPFFGGGGGNEGVRGGLRALPGIVDAVENLLSNAEDDLSKAADDR